jgi:hypothetical protein
MATIQPQKSSDVQLQVPVFQPAPTQMNTMPYPVQFTGTALSNGVDGVIKGLQAGFQLRHQLADMPNETKRAQLAGRYIDEANQAMDDYHQGKYDPLMAGLRSDASGATGMDFSRVPDMPMRDIQLQAGKQDLQKGQQQLGIGQRQITAADLGNLQTAQNIQLAREHTDFEKWKAGQALQGGFGRGTNQPPPMPPDSVSPEAQKAAQIVGTGQTVATPSPPQPTNTPPFSIDDAESYYLTHYGNDATSVNWVHPQQNQPGYYVVSRKGKDPVSLYPSIMASDPGDWRPSSAQSQTPAAGAPPVPSWATNAPLGQGAQDQDLALEMGTFTDTPQAQQQRAQGSQPLPSVAVTGPQMPQAPVVQGQSSADDRPMLNLASFADTPNSARDRDPVEVRNGVKVYMDPYQNRKYIVSPGGGDKGELRFYDGDPSDKPTMIPNPTYDADQDIIKHAVAAGMDPQKMSRAQIITELSKQENAKLHNYVPEQKQKELDGMYGVMQAQVDLRDALHDLKPGEINVISEGWDNVKRKWGNLVGQQVDPNHTRVYQAYNQIKSAIRVAEDGKTLTPGEAQDLLAKVGSPSDSDFKQKMDKLASNLQDKYVLMTHGAQSAGYKVPDTTLDIANAIALQKEQRGEGKFSKKLIESNEKAAGVASADATSTAEPASNNSPIVIDPRNKEAAAAAYEKLAPKDRYINALDGKIYKKQ